MQKKIISEALEPVTFFSKNVTALQTTRKSPFSECKSTIPFDGFNLGEHVGDSPTLVAINRQQLQNYFNFKTSIQWLNQVHSNDVCFVTEPTIEPITADAIVTRRPHIALAIMTADCLPILLSNEEGTEIAAIHGGWRPLANDIIMNTLKKMTSSNEKIRAWLGPCIGVKAFEVGAEVKTAFTNRYKELEPYFFQSDNNKYYADLTSIAKKLLFLNGVINVDSIDECTYGLEKKYYSYRRDNITGRMATIICIN